MGFGDSGATTAPPRHQHPGPCSPKPVLFEFLFPLHSLGSLKATVSLTGGETGSRRPPLRGPSSTLPPAPTPRRIAQGKAAVGVRKD